MPGFGLWRAINAQAGGDEGGNGLASAFQVVATILQHYAGVSGHTVNNTVGKPALDFADIGRIEKDLHIAPPSVERSSEARQRAAVFRHVGDLAPRHARIHRCLRHSR